MPPDVHLIDTGRTLDGFASQLRDADGVDTRELAPGRSSSCAPAAPAIASWWSNPRPDACSSAVVIGSPFRRKHDSWERPAAAAC